MDKQTLRKQCLQKRKDWVCKQDANKKIKDKVLKLCHPYQNIGIYVSLIEEVDTRCIIDQLWQQKKTVLVPRCVDHTLTFHCIQNWKELELSCFNLLEPITEAVDLSIAEVLFIPLVGFDHNKNRLGYGKGYYDSILNQYKKLKIGLAYSIQEVKEIPFEPHDVKLDQIITEII